MIEAGIFIPQGWVEGRHLRRYISIGLKCLQVTSELFLFIFYETEQRGSHSNLGIKKEDGSPSPPVCLPVSGQIVRVVPRSLVPAEALTSKDKELEDQDAFRDGRRGIMGHLEVVDVGRRSLR